MVSEIAMALILLVYVILGCVLESIAMMLITVPVFLPLILELGYDPVWFGVMVVVVVEIGLVTPPIGTTLFVASSVGDVSIADMVPHVLRFFVVMVAAQLVITYVPHLTTWPHYFIR